MENKEETLTVTRQSNALAEAEKSSNYVNISLNIVNELLSSIHSNMLKEVSCFMTNVAMPQFENPPTLTF